MSRKLKILAAAFLAVLDEILAVALLLILLPSLGVKVPPAYAALTFGVLAVVSYFLYLALKPVFLAPPRVGVEAMVGLRGEALTPLNPKGLVSIGGEVWRAIALDGTVNPGERIQVVEVEGLTVKVRKV